MISQKQNFLSIYYKGQQFDFLKLEKYLTAIKDKKRQACDVELPVDEPLVKCSNFSIEYILGFTKKPETEKFICSEKLYEQDEKEGAKNASVKAGYDWLNCTRYKPPKLQRLKKRKVNTPKRRLGRNPRIPFSTEQVSILENKFRLNPYVSHADVAQLSRMLQLSECRVKIWFQNRRAREKRENHPHIKCNHLVESFLRKTRHFDSAELQIPEQLQKISTSAFKRCHV